MIRLLLKNDRPRERFLSNGPNALAENELLALLLRTGTKDQPVLNLASSLLSQKGSLSNVMQADIHELLSVKGIGLAKAVQIKAAYELALRYQTASKAPVVRIIKPSDAYNVVKTDLMHKKIEQVYLLSLGVNCSLISKHLISIGTVSETLLHPREVFGTALKTSASYIILVHNHPSNDPTPSDEDTRVTHELEKAGNLLGIPLLDHIIFCDDTYFSLKACQEYKVNVERR